ncbi:hypothetical protein ISG29_15535 [Nocardioides sp. CBS4Y-1]|uniref:Uncharacterized protein n=1 Tax=Nocardioides acrostichi TaxID=2784339 RepID=A0A930V0G0_9ACTN|nr:hypothetical protein [Nocardioides acrostichi]
MSFVLRNEFANIRVSTEAGQCGVRLKITDLETGSSTYLDLLELAGLCEWPEEERLIPVQGHLYAEHTEREVGR